VTEICSRGTEIYNRKYKQVYEPYANGKYAAIDLGSETIQVADSFLSLETILRPRDSTHEVFVLRIGFPALFTIG
jgi:hypothetical protein